MGVSQAVKSDSREPRGGNLTAEGFSEMRGVDGLALRPMREYQIHLAEPDAETETGVLLTPCSQFFDKPFGQGDRAPTPLRLGLRPSSQRVPPPGPPEARPDLSRCHSIEPQAPHHGAFRWMPSATLAYRVEAFEIAEEGGKFLIIEHLDVSLPRLGCGLHIEDRRLP